MNNKTIIQILLIFLSVQSFIYGKSIDNLNSVLVAKAIGYSMTNEKNISKVNIDNVQSKLHNYIKDTGFHFNSIFVDWSQTNGSNLHIKGIIVHSDAVDRNIQTRFDALCKIIDKNTIIVNNVQLTNIAQPRVKFFIVPSNKVNPKQLCELSFPQALNHLDSVAKKLDTNTQMDLQPQNYTIIAFMMNKINENNLITSVMSNQPYNESGQLGTLIRTTDRWYMTVVETQFAYNNFQPKYFNILWEKDNIVRATHSFSTHSLLKTIQLTLQSKGYDIGKLNGHLNKQTKKAIQKYIKKNKFHQSTQITSSLLWFMQQDDNLNISKIVQKALLLHGKKVGQIDGKIGNKTIQALKEYQKVLGVNPDGKITPELVYLLLQTTKNVNTYHQIKTLFPKPILIENYQDKLWPNEA